MANNRVYLKILHQLQLAKEAQVNRAFAAKTVTSTYASSTRITKLR
jgi:hypothetical protein